MRLAELLIVFAFSACVGWTSEERGKTPIISTAEGLSQRGTLVQSRDGGGWVDRGGARGDFGQRELGSLTPMAAGLLATGDYTQEIVSVFYAWEEREDLALGEQSVVTVTDGPTGASLHGFVELMQVGPEVSGSGLLIEADPGYDCVAEWMQAVEGTVQPDGRMELQISEVVAVAGKQCALTDLGDPHLEENLFVVTLVPL